MSKKLNEMRQQRNALALKRRAQYRVSEKTVEAKFHVCSASGITQVKPSL